MVQAGGVDAVGYAAVAKRAGGSRGAVRSQGQKWRLCRHYLLKGDAAVGVH